MKHRPRIVLLAPPRVRPGEAAEAIVLLTARREVELDAVRVTLLRRDTWAEGDERRRAEANLGGGMLCGRATLPPGATELRWTLWVPPGSPPSFSGALFQIEYVAEVHAPIAWWPDARGRFLVNVAAAAPAEPGHPRRYSTAPEGPRGLEPYAEVSLETDVLAAGGSLRGAAALGNLAHNRVVGLELRLLGHEETAHGRRERFRFVAPIPRGDLADLRPIPFVFGAPAELAPSFESERGALRWTLELGVALRFQRDLVIPMPITVRPPPTGPARPTAPRRAPPTVGAERLREVWQAAGARVGLAWTDDGVLRGRLAGAAVEVRRELQDTAGPHLVAELAYPPLHLGLTLRPGGRLALALGARPGLRLGRGVLDGRDRAQVAAFARLAAPALAPFARAQLDDERARLEARGAGGSVDRLVVFLEAVGRLAAALAAARERIPPPAAIAEGLPRWRALADRLDGALETARMGIRGTLDGDAVEIATEWTAAGAPVATVVTLRPAAPLAAGASFTWIPGEDRSPPEGASGDARLRALVDAIAGADARAVRLAPDALSIELPAPLLDPAPLLERLAAMARLCARLREAVGVYR